MRWSHGLGWFAVLASGCGGATAPSPPPEPAPAPAAPEPEPTNPKDDLSAEDRAVMEDRRANFIAICNGNGNNGDYCACTWDQLREVVSREELLVDRASPDQVRELQRRALLYCVEEISEDTVKEAFRGGCMTKANEAFCDCTYRELRERVSARDIATRGGEDGEGFMRKRNEALQACMSDMDEATVKSNFVRGCMDSGGAEARCLCAWDVAKKEVSLVDIALDRIDLEKIRPMVRKQCGQPAPP